MLVTAVLQAAGAAGTRVSSPQSTLQTGTPPTENPATSQIRSKPVESQQGHVRSPNSGLWGFPKPYPVKEDKQRWHYPPQPTSPGQRSRKAGQAARSTLRAQTPRPSSFASEPNEGRGSGPINAESKSPWRGEHSAAWRGLRCPGRGLVTGNDSGLHADAPRLPSEVPPPQAG